VWSGTEPKMVQCLSSDVERVRVLEDTWVAVGYLVSRYNPITSGHDYTADFDFFAGHTPPTDMSNREVAQHLLDRVQEQGSIVSQQVQFGLGARAAPECPTRSS
jgi:hypothetical protein